MQERRKLMEIDESKFKEQIWNDLQAILLPVMKKVSPKMVWDMLPCEVKQYALEEMRREHGEA